MSQDQVAISSNSSRAITGIEIYSSIRNFRRQHEEDPDLEHKLNEHLMQQIHVLIERISQAKDKAWLADRILGGAHAKLQKAKLREQRDDLHMQELQAEVQFLRRDAASRYALAELQNVRRQTIVGSDISSLLAEDPTRIRSQAHFDSEQRRLEDMIIQNLRSWETGQHELINKRMEVSAEILRVPFFLDPYVTSPGTSVQAQDPFNDSSSSQDGFQQSVVQRTDQIDSAIFPAKSNDISLVDDVAQIAALGEDIEHRKHNTEHTDVLNDFTTTNSVEASIVDIRSTFNIKEDHHHHPSSAQPENPLDDSMTTAVDDGAVENPVDNPECDKENRPVVSTPPPSPDISKDRGIPEGSGQCIGQQETVDGSHQPVKQSFDSPREVLGVLYDESDYVIARKPPTSRPHGQARSTRKSPRKRQAPINGEELNRRSPTKVSSHVEGNIAPDHTRSIQKNTRKRQVPIDEEKTISRSQTKMRYDDVENITARRSKRLRRVNSAELRMNEG